MTDDEKTAIKGSLRLWPHKIKGEGHFAVRLRKNGGETATQKKKKNHPAKIFCLKAKENS